MKMMVEFFAGGLANGGYKYTIVTNSVRRRGARARPVNVRAIDLGTANLVVEGDARLKKKPLWISHGGT